MKELIRVITIRTTQITQIVKADEEELEDIIRDDKDTEAFEEKLKEYLQADDVKVTDIQNFVIDKV